MARDTQIANKLRNASLKVVEIAGWQTRGSSTFNPRGIVTHHTAGASTGNAPSLNVCIYGRGGSNPVPGPLCNVLVGRDNTCYVIAAGRANHAGTGSWNGLVGNSSVYGIEFENQGYPHAEPWRLDQVETMTKIAAALVPDAAYACFHKEWAPGRKPDPHSLDGNLHRLDVNTALNPPPPPPAENPFAPTDRDRMHAEETMPVGEYFTSPGGQFALVMQHDGNLVVYESTVPLWASGTNGLSGDRVIMQGDGNLVVYTADNVALWASGTHNNPGAWVILQTDGNLVVYDAAHKALWDSKGFAQAAAVDLAAIGAAIERSKQQILRPGASGEAVWWAQALLNDKIQANLALDGYFGATTTAAVKQFQRNVRDYFNLGSKMAVDGIVGPATWFWLVA